MQLWSKKNNKNSPDFWKKYSALFDGKTKQKSWEETRFVAFDTETTGFDFEKDRVLSIGAVGIKDNSINVADQLELYLKQEIFNQDTVEIHGIRKNADLDQISEEKALQWFIEFIGDSILVAHHARFDTQMIDKALKRNGLGALKNKVLDTSTLFKHTKHQVYRNDFNRPYSLEELCKDLKISESDRHTASGDAFITALAFLKIISKLRRDKKIQKLKDLFALSS
ncbi:3'-5' exonuclease [Aquimarina gracilis]|uniref:3'-5' exonuclease n=1 Tax=Aquimarina gracilis TaxID=874422 RepID=A0ABU5ZQS7_9FLAO|nr:3'-5' exonuclease [Aquimarina gracilis]MEB3344273.1 3'-5' exonuclease [Aquimarina gracilis]